MNCVTGLELYSDKLTMRELSHFACENFLDLTKEPPNSPFIAYQRTICDLTTQFEAGNFTQFKDAFCLHATDAVKKTAQTVHTGLLVKMAYIQRGHLGTAAATGLLIGAAVMHKKGYTNVSKSLVSAAVGAVAFAAMSYLHIL